MAGRIVMADHCIELVHARVAVAPRVLLAERPRTNRAEEEPPQHHDEHAQPQVEERVQASPVRAGVRSGGGSTALLRRATGASRNLPVMDDQLAATLPDKGGGRLLVTGGRGTIAHRAGGQALLVVGHITNILLLSLVVVFLRVHPVAGTKRAALLRPVFGMKTGMETCMVRVGGRRCREAGPPFGGDGWWLLCQLFSHGCSPCAADAGDDCSACALRCRSQ